jgi:hypothetical protein
MESKPIDSAFVVCCLWEEFLNQVLSDTPGFRSEDTEAYGGTQGMRLLVIGLIDHCEEAWQIALEHEYDGPFDWEFVPWFMKECVTWPEGKVHADWKNRLGYMLGVEFRLSPEACLIMREIRNQCRLGRILRIYQNRMESESYAKDLDEYLVSLFLALRPNEYEVYRLIAQAGKEGTEIQKPETIYSDQDVSHVVAHVCNALRRIPVSNLPGYRPRRTEEP